MKKKLSKKIILGAAALMAFSTGATITGTYAWFVASNTVAVSGMSIKAQAEDGIVMANETHTAAANWGTEITASHNGAGLAYVPTSTKDCTAWYHANSNNVDDKTAATPYETLTVTAPVEVDGNGAGVVASSSPAGSNAVDKNVYFLNKFYLQSAAESATGITGQDVMLTDLTVSETGTAQDLNKALRIAFKYDAGNLHIFNALSTATTTYAVNDEANAVTLETKPVEATDSTHCTLGSNVTIPAYTTAGTNAKPLSVYMWFEGEDANCKSANIAASMNNISITFTVKNVSHQN